MPDWRTKSFCATAKAYGLPSKDIVFSDPPATLNAWKDKSLEMGSSVIK